MKKLIIAFLVFVPILINAQTFWSIVDDNNDHNISHTLDKGLLQDSIILVGGYISDASCPYYNLLAYNKNGNMLWNLGSICDVIKTDSDFVYTAGYDIGADDVGGDEYLVIAKYNNRGEEIFKIKYHSEEYFNYYDFIPKNIELVTDGTILISSNNSIIKSNINGTKIERYNVILGSQINAIQSINPVSYLINTHNKIYKTDSSFTLVDSLEFSNSINKLLVVNDTVFTLCDSYLLRIDANLNIIDTIITSSVDLKNMEYYENELWVQTFSSDSISLLKLKNFEISDTLIFPILMNNAEFIVSKNNYTFVGNSFANQIGICNFKNETSEIEAVALPDIKLIDFDIDSVVIEYYQYQEISYAIGYSFNVELTVKNNSALTITSFAVFADLHGGVNCAQNYFYQKITDLEILPGQTQVLKLKRAYEDGVNNNQLCFQCMAPNSKLEVDTSDNSLCKTFTITGIENEKEANLKIYPNPISKYIIIEHPDLGVKNIEIIDINGKVFFKGSSSEQRISIETTNLTTGLYVVKIKTGNKINTQLIMKE